MPRRKQKSVAAKKAWAAKSAKSTESPANDCMEVDEGRQMFSPVVDNLAQTAEQHAPSEVEELDNSVEAMDLFNGKISYTFGRLD